MGKCSNRHLFFLRRILITSAVTRKIIFESSSAINLLFSALTLSVSYLFYNYKNIQILNEMKINLTRIKYERIIFLFIPVIFRQTAVRRV